MRALWSRSEDEPVLSDADLAHQIRVTEHMMNTALEDREWPDVHAHWLSLKSLRAEHEDRGNTG
jgi:hypothetical protein